MNCRYDIVIPSLGRSSLYPLLGDLGDASDAARIDVFVVDDRRSPQHRLSLPDSVKTVCGRGSGPAHARNVGWRSGTAEWVVFLDDDVRLDQDWTLRLREDLRSATTDVGGVQGQVLVPLPTDRPPTDWERNVAGLASARWVTADMAYRRAVLEEVGGFDESFGRAFREDADLALRVERSGWRLVSGTRRISHPVRDTDALISVRQQVNNAEDARMRVRHGRQWRRRIGAEGPGRLSVHCCAVASLSAACLLTAARSRLAAYAWLAWLTLLAEFTWRRVAPGPRTPKECATMLATSAVIPPLAFYHRVRGELQVRRRDGRATRRRKP